MGGRGASSHLLVARRTLNVLQMESLLALSSPGNGGGVSLPPPLLTFGPVQTRTIRSDPSRAFEFFPCARRGERFTFPAG